MGQSAHGYDHALRRAARRGGRGHNRMTGEPMSQIMEPAHPWTVEAPAPVDRAQRRRAFWGVMACFLVHGLVVSTWVSRIASVKAALHLSDGSLGLALLGTAAGSVTAIPMCGALVVRFGSRGIARGTAAGFCVSLVAIPLARDTATLFAALLFYGAMAVANDVAMNAQAVATEKRLGTAVISDRK